MLFSVLRARGVPPANVKNRAFLVSDNWDDYTYKTTFTLLVVDHRGKRHRIGTVKIAQQGMGRGHPDIPREFQALDERFFSLGQDDSYYAGLGELGEDVRRAILGALRDIALDPSAFERASGEAVTERSLFRDVSRSTVLGQFRRLALGGARLSRFAFAYTAPATRQTSGIRLTFSVEPESRPPSNIHVLIGANGVGKTFLLNKMMAALLADSASVADAGQFTFDGVSGTETDSFAGLVLVTFSAFDPFQLQRTSRRDARRLRHSYIGLHRSRRGKALPPKTQRVLAREFAQSVIACRQGARLSRWRKALETLESDAIFRDARLADIADFSDRQSKRRASAIFRNLSSGHKAVLLTITRLVEVAEERTLVLWDEPEAHLHPPLLSALVRALSDLLVDRNGVAVIATHSPVVLQEVPKKCVWKIRRSGDNVVRERPSIETFGENVGILTREAFGLEVTEAGFHRLLRDAVDGRSYGEVLDAFEGELGDEARAILRAMTIARDSRDRR
jgi:ABC-type multidrug transport system ATPase subunit